MKNLILLVCVVLLAGCVSTDRVSNDADYNYAAVFSDMTASRPVILNSRLERYSKDFGLWKGSERNGEWEFELLASKAWVDQAKQGFIPTTFKDPMRWPSVAWWTPNEENFDAYRMPYSSYSAAHFYVEKAPKDGDRIHVFIQRH